MMNFPITVNIQRTTTSSLDQIVLPISECVLESHFRDGKPFFYMMQRYRYGGETSATVFIKHDITENEYKRIKAIIEYIG